MKKLSIATKQEMSKNDFLGKKLTESILYNKEESVMLFMASKGENVTVKCAVTTFNYKGKTVAIESMLISRKINKTVYTQPIMLEGYEIEDKDLSPEALQKCFFEITNENMKKVEMVLKDLHE